MSDQNQKTKITIKGILADLENGLTRTTDSKNYNAEKGCIATKYGLNDFDIKSLFKHEELKGKKTKVNKTKSLSFVIVSDEEMIQESSEAETTTEEVAVEVVEEVVAETEVVEEVVAEVEDATKDAW